MQTQFTLERKKILIVDDDTVLLELLNDFLSNQGFDVQTSQNGSVLDSTDQYQADLIILDYILDGINGGELCHQIKKSITGKHIPVILFSAYPRVFLSLGNYGCDQFIPKPFDLDFFLDSIKQHLGSSSRLLNSAMTSPNGRPAVYK